LLSDIKRKRCSQITGTLCLHKRVEVVVV
jgi:hypothetical protein